VVSTSKSDDERILDEREGLLRVRWSIMENGLGVEIERERLGAKRQAMHLSPDAALGLLDWLERQRYVLEKAARAQFMRRERKKRDEQTKAVPQ